MKPRHLTITPTTCDAAMRRRWLVKIGSTGVGWISLMSDQSFPFTFTSERDDMPKTFARRTMREMRSALITQVSRDTYMAIYEASKVAA